MRLADDYILLEEIPPPPQLIVTLEPKAGQPIVVLAKVLAVGPGDPYAGGRHSMPCKEGDTVFVFAGSGIRFKDYEGNEHWFAYGGRKDIVAVIDEVNSEG
jgi:co-chaperonin GroES (HSP10)